MIKKYFTKIWDRIVCEHYWEELKDTQCFMCPKCGKVKYATYNDQRRNRAKLLRDNVFNKPKEEEIV